MTKNVPKFIVLSGWILSLTVLTLILLTALAIFIMGHELPHTLAEWAGIALGFIFGSLTNIIKDYVTTTTESDL